MEATTTQWKPSADTMEAYSAFKYIGTMGVETSAVHEYFEVLDRGDRLVFGGACNAGFMESGYRDTMPWESTDDALAELLADLEVYYADGPEYVSDIVCNERM